MKTKALILLLLPLLSSCLPVPGLFYIGRLSEDDQALFREAARIEDVDTVDWPAPGAWWVEYGAPQHANGETWPGIIFIASEIKCDCADVDGYTVIVMRHEIRHTEGERHSDDPFSLMHDPAPCWPQD